MPDTSPAGNGADVLLEQLERQGVDCIFASPIAVMAPIWEALARRGDARGPRYFRCRHELLAMGLASGYYKATGRGQVVFLPSSLGVQNGSMGLHTALQERTPVTVLSPDTLSYGEDPDADPGPEWPSLLVDLVGPARNAEAVTKWAHRARTGSEMVNELRRACFIAQSVPLGPTLLEIPFDLLMASGPTDIPDWVSPVPVVAAGSQIDEAAQILARAENPVIVTEHGGSTEAQRAALVSIAESLSAPVFEFMMPAYHNFPRSHPLYGAGPVEDVLAAATARLTAFTAIARDIPSTDVVLRVVPRLPDGVASVTVSAVEWQVLAAVDGRRFVAAITAQVGHSAFTVFSTLHRLLQAGAVQRVDR